MENNFVWEQQHLSFIWEVSILNGLYQNTKSPNDLKELKRCMRRNRAIVDVLATHPIVENIQYQINNA